MAKKSRAGSASERFLEPFRVTDGEGFAREQIDPADTLGIEGKREAQALLASWNDTALADHRRQLKAGWKALRDAERFWERQNPPRAARDKAKTGEPQWT